MVHTTLFSFGEKEIFKLITIPPTFSFEGSSNFELLKLLFMSSMCMLYKDQLRLFSMCMLHKETTCAETFKHVQAIIYEFHVHVI